MVTPPRPPPSSSVLPTRAKAAEERAADDDSDQEPDTAPGVDADAASDRPPAEDVRAAMLLHEAAAVLNLHAQAAGVQNIRSLIPVVLDATSGPYTRWREQFLLAVGRFALQDHVFLDAPPPSSPDWERMDCVVRSWLHSTISADLAEVVMGRGGSARAAWLAIEAQFLGNRETHALHLDAQFRHFCQGDLSITDYCRKLKSMADDLADLGEPVTDRTLVLNVIRNLNENFTDIGRHLRRGRPFPTFLDVRNDLLLEEITAAQRNSAAPTALLATGAGGAA